MRFFIIVSNVTYCSQIIMNYAGREKFLFVTAIRITLSGRFIETHLEPWGYHFRQYKIAAMETKNGKTCTFPCVKNIDNEQMIC